MNAYTISALKKELSTLPHGDVIDICLRLAKYKKENKELLTYLLFDSNNEAEYIRSVKEEIDMQFSEVNLHITYFAKKSIRKILRTTSKHIKYSKHKRTEVELLICFCAELKKSGFRIRASNSISNLYNNQIKKINAAVSSLHEDLQHDYLEEIKALNTF